MLPELQNFQRWMAWKIAPNDRGGFSKQPFNPVTGGFASCNDPATWGTYEAAKASVAAAAYDSIGFVLGKEVGLVVVDFDKVRPSVDAPWPQWVLDEIEELDSYTEVSASGCGLHVLVFGEIPSNTNKQQNHVEIWDSNKMFAFSGDVLEGRDQIKAHDMSAFAARVYAGHIGPTYRPKLIVEKYDSPKFRALCDDDLAAVSGDRSRAVASVLCMLALKHNFDRDAMREAFEATPLCEAWREKWARLSEREISRACQYVHDRTPALPQPANLAFKFPRVPGGIREYVLQPRDKYDGWFPRGRVSLVGGPSGGGKTSLVVDLLDQQSQGKKYLGHQGSRLPYVILFADRGELSNQETLERMGLLERDLNLDHMPELVYGGAAADAVLQCIENQRTMPAAVFVEGGDLLVEDPNRAPVVGAFLKDLQRIAQFYHIAIILSVGAPKAKEKDMHTLKRDRIFGSQIWSRMCETIATLSVPGDGTGASRALDVQHRNAASESFELEFHKGLLRPVANEPTSDDPLLIWCSTQTEPFTRQEAIKAMADADAGLGRSAVYDRIKKLLAGGAIVQEYNGSTVLLKWKQPILTPEQNELNSAVNEAIQ